MVSEQYEAHFAVLLHYTQNRLISTWTRLVPLDGLLLTPEDYKKRKVGLKDEQSRNKCLGR